VKISVITKKNNLKKLAKYAAKITKAKAEYGYFKEQGKHPSGLSYATLMAIHEYGASNGIPARKPFSIALFGNQAQMFRFTLKSLDKYMMSASNNAPIPLERTLGTFGSLGVYHTKALFGSGALLANKTPIRKRSGSTSNTPLVDFGNLKETMGYRSTENKEIKTNA